MSPTVSVGIVTYNQKALLREAIDSVLAQDYPAFDIVVADDGSRDGTHEMLRDYAARCPGRFTLCLAKTNQGITANCNRVLEAATGKYIAWLGGDDIMLPGKLARQVAVLEADPTVSMCVHSMDVFRSSDGQTIRIQSPAPFGRLRYGAEDIVRSMNCIIGSSVMMRRSMCPAHGHDFRIPQVSDFLFWVEVAVQGPVVALDEVLGRYRRHDDNWTQPGFIHHLDIGVTLQVIESRYGELLPAVNWARYRLNYDRGVDYALAGDRSAAARLLWNSLRYRIRLNPLVWLLVLYAPRPMRETARDRWLKRTHVIFQK